jgi:hypothetical protein
MKLAPDHRAVGPVVVGPVVADLAADAVVLVVAGMEDAADVIDVNTENHGL